MTQFFGISVKPGIWILEIPLKVRLLKKTSIFNTIFVFLAVFLFTFRVFWCKKRSVPAKVQFILLIEHFKCDSLRNSRRRDPLPVGVEAHSGIVACHLCSCKQCKILSTHLHTWLCQFNGACSICCIGNNNVSILKRARFWEETIYLNHPLPLMFQTQVPS